MRWCARSRSSVKSQPSDDQTRYGSKQKKNRFCPTESCPGTSGKLSEWDLEQIRIKQNELKQKEKEILKTHEKLKKKYKIYLKREKERENKALEAEAKLKEAKKKLMLVMKATDKLKKYNKKKCNKRKHEKKSKKQPKRKVNSDTDKSIFNIVWHKIHKIFCLPPENAGCCPGSRMGTRFMPFCTPNSFQSGCSSRLGMPFGPCFLDRRCGDTGASGDCYLMSLRRAPPMCIPRLFPRCFGVKTLCKQLGFCLLLALAILFWTPIFICLELLCKCCYCACCTDCC